MELLREKLGFWGCLPSLEHRTSGMDRQVDAPQGDEPGAAIEQDMSVLRARSRLVSTHAGMNANWSLKRGGLLAQSPSHFRSMPSSLGRRSFNGGRQLSSAGSMRAYSTQGQRAAMVLGASLARGVLKLLR